MTDLEISNLKAAGIDVESALERFMGKQNLLKKFLFKFLSDPNYEKLKAAIDADDKDGALVASHTLKGVCGNLSMSSLFALFTKQVDAIRAGNWDMASGLMPQIDDTYNKVKGAIEALS